MTRSASIWFPRGSKTLVLSTSWGNALLLYQPRPFLLQRVFLPGCKIASAEPPQATGADALTQVRLVADEIIQYFKGAVTTPGGGGKIPATWLDWTRVTRRERSILEEVREIPCGTTRTYGGIAARAGFPGGGRFVGNTMAKNPWPLIIPCHRVVRADGRPGGFGGGEKMKKRLLRMEAGACC